MKGVVRSSKGDLDEGTLGLIKKTYPVGTKVEAIRVRYIPKGMQGFVREVRKDGDISVIWNNGDVTCAEFGVDSIKVVRDGECLLGYNMEKSGCGSNKCSKCGWNDRVAKERIRRIRNGEMKRQKNGRWALEVEKY